MGSTIPRAVICRESRGIGHVTACVLCSRQRLYAIKQRIKRTALSGYVPQYRRVDDTHGSFIKLLPSPVRFYRPPVREKLNVVADVPTSEIGIEVLSTEASANHRGCINIHARVDSLAPGIVTVEVCRYSALV